MLHIYKQTPLRRWLIGEMMTNSCVELNLNHHILAAPLTCLRLFSSAGDSTEDKDSKIQQESSRRKSSGKQKGDDTISTSTPDMLQNAKLWRQWVDGRLEDRARPPLGLTPRQQHHNNRPRDSTKDWKSASRSQRSAQNRIANIMAPESGRRSWNGKYGILGTASDAPRIVAGASARAEEISPSRIHPHRLWYPGATYAPEDLDPFKAKEVFMSSDLTTRRNTIPARAAEAQGDFRNANFLRNFLNESGKLLPRRKTRLPAKVHRELARQVKLSRAMALMNPTTKWYTSKY